MFLIFVVLITNSRLYDVRLYASKIIQRVLIPTGRLSMYISKELIFNGNGCHIFFQGGWLNNRPSSKTRQVLTAELEEEHTARSIENFFYPSYRQRYGNRDTSTTVTVTPRRLVGNWSSLDLINTL